MKKSVIAAVAASNVTIFSGLVNAIENPLFAGSGTVQPCIFKKEALLEPGGQPFASTFELEPKICKGFPLVVGVHSDVPSVRA